MDIKNLKQEKSFFSRKVSFRFSEWLEKRLVIGKYSYPRKTLAGVGLIAAVLLISLLFLISYRNSYLDPNAATQKEIRSVTKHIEKYMELPQNEQPTLATVSDREKLKDQDFFAHAQNGDKVLFYSKTGKAILFRPSTGKIIEVASFTSGDQNEYSPAEPAVNLPSD